MAKAKNPAPAGYVATLEAPIETPPAVAAQNGPKRKGKAPGKKTLIVREGIAEYPNKKPKALADFLNEKYPGFDITNNDVSQQRQLLKIQSGKKKGKKVAGEKPAAAAETITIEASSAKVGGDVRQVADLAKQLGTAKIRELCDLIDYVTK